MDKGLEVPSMTTRSDPVDKELIITTILWTSTQNILLEYGSYEIAPY